MNRLAPLLFALTLLVPALAQAQMTPEQRNLKLSQAWQWMEAGSLDKADTAFKEVLADDQGHLIAEVHYGLAAVWWQKRNAMASYQRLVEATQLMGAFNWDAGEGNLWDARIKSRITYVEKNFTVIKMKAEAKTVIPPLADPPPKDPLLREFTDQMTTNVADSVADGTSTLWMFLVNGQYWLGEELKQVDGGEMDSSKAETWTLPRRTGAAKSSFESKQQAIADGRSPAAELADGTASKDGKETPKKDDKEKPKKDKPPKGDVEIVHRAFAFGFQGGLAPTRALDGLDESVAADWTIGAMAEGRLPLPPPILSIAVGASWKLLPVNGCRVQPTRGHLAALHVGPALQLPLSGPANLSIDAVFRGGYLIGGRSPAERASCADAITASESAAGAVERGAKVTADGTSGTLSLSDLGWQGRAGAVGGELAAGLVLDGGGPIGFGVQLVFTYDHLIPTLPGGGETVWIRDPTTGAVSSVPKSAAGAAASMGRMQAGLRLRLLL